MKSIKEYAFENRKPIDISPLKASYLNDKDYEMAHKSLVIVTHDILIEYQKGFLLVLRNKVPEKGEYWPIGGRINRGMPLLESIHKKVKEESGLDVDNIVPIGYRRTFFATDPFCHGKGTDTLNLGFYAKGTGTLQLDSLHLNHIIITKEMFTPELKKTLHPCVLDLLEEGFKLIC